MRRADFVRASQRGRKLVTRYFLVLVHDRGDGGRTRLGVTVTRKVGKAVRRNRIKRLVREWFQHSGQELGPCDLNVIAKQSIPEGIGLQQVEKDLNRALAVGGTPCAGS
jgi:ribonuclease P protein component